jgi:long-chain fatty acid transport protein
LRCIAFSLILVLAAASLAAQGFSLHSQAACPLARNSTGVAEPCADGSAVFYNPAALVSQRSVASLGALALYSKAKFTFDTTGTSFDSEQETAFAPHAWVALQLKPGIGAGVGIWAPYGLTTAWPLDFEGRYTGYDNTLQAIYIQPTLAVEVLPNRLALGAGVAAVNGLAKLHRRLDLARTPIPGTNQEFSAIGVPDGTDFADAELDTDAWSATFHVGLQWRPTGRWSVGTRYLHTTTLDLSGSARFDQLPTGFTLPAGNPFGLPPGTPIDLLLAPQFRPGEPLGNQRISTEITLPNQFVAGVRYLASSAIQVFFDYQWTGWDHFDQAALDFANAPMDTVFFDYHDASTFRLAVEYVPRDNVTIRGGVLHNSEAAPAVSVTPLVPEARRTSLAVGVGYGITDRLHADVGFEVLIQADRRGSVRPRVTRTETASDLNVGRYSAHGVFGGLTLSYLLRRER